MFGEEEQGRLGGLAPSLTVIGICNANFLHAVTLLLWFDQERVLKYMN